MKRKFDKVRECEKKLTDLKNQPGKIDELQRPAAVFITFSEESTFLKATRIKDFEITLGSSQTE